MSASPRSFAYESMGTQWRISIWDELDDAVYAEMQSAIIAQSETFDRTYSRFMPDSLVQTLAQQTGTVTVPTDLVAMLRLYRRLHALSGGACNPLVGHTLSDMGYDADYSLTPKEHIRETPNFEETIEIVDDTTITLHTPVLIDVGALGKGYFVDTIAAYLDERGMRRFLVDGSGDILYRSDSEPLRVGLEHPADPSKVIGVIELTNGSLCGSGSNRRRWGAYHHIVDPRSLTVSHDILATWVQADSAAVADALATCLFLADPSLFEHAWPFEYLMLNDTYKAKRSAGFTAELF